MADPDCRKFLLHSAALLNWGDLSGKVVMDVGCGRGSNSTYSLMELFPNIAKLVAIDQNTDELEMARLENFDPKVEFHYGSIEERPTVVRWEDQMQVIVSHYCFNCIKAQNEAFANLYRLLETGGSAAILFTLWANFYDWANEIGEMYIQHAANFAREPPESHTKNYQASHYIQMLTDIGFEIIECEDEHHCRQFETDIQCQRYLGSICPVSSHIPREEIDNFLYNIFLHFLKHNPRNEEGFTSLRYRTARILVTKPRSNE